VSEATVLPANASRSVVETERLLLRPSQRGDAPALFTFLGDPLAMRFTQVHSSLEACAEYLRVHEAQRDIAGCAPWTVIGKQEGQIIGFGGLYEDPFEPGWGVEVAYFFRPSSWGKGYATELTLASLEFAKREKCWPTIQAFAHTDNKASSRVLELYGCDVL
jgi:[ribosomal protein S5]-alanine N-acetyltransferase